MSVLTLNVSLAQTEDRRYLELKVCAAADVRYLLGAPDAPTGAAALTVFSCLSGGDYDRGAERIGPKHAATVVRSLLADLPKVKPVCPGRSWTRRDHAANKAREVINTHLDIISNHR